MKVKRILLIILSSILLTSSLNITKVEAANNSVEAFVERLYTIVLKRSSEKAGKNYWVKNLKTRQKTGAEVAYGFFFSKEFIKKNVKDDVFVETLYLTMLDRKSDSNGKKYWLNKLKNGMSREFVYKGFSESKEFGGICNSSGITRGTVRLNQNRDQNEGVTGFVNRNYTKILGRNGEASGLNYWTGQINSASNQKQKAAEVAYGFFNSKEFKNKNTSNEEFVKICYRQFLNREAELGGLKYWLCILSKSNRDNVIAGIAQSKEFNTIMNGYGLTGSVSLNHNHCNGACSSSSKPAPTPTPKPTPKPTPTPTPTPKPQSCKMVTETYYETEYYEEDVIISEYEEEKCSLGGYQTRVTDYELTHKDVWSGWQWTGMATTIESSREIYEKCLKNPNNCKIYYPGEIIKEMLNAPKKIKYNGQIINTPEKVYQTLLNGGKCNAETGEICIITSSLEHDKNGNLVTDELGYAKNNKVFMDNLAQNYEYIVTNGKSSSTHTICVLTGRIIQETTKETKSRQVKKTREVEVCK